MHGDVILPVGEIDRASERIVPICRELQTGAGPLDILYATPEGRLVIAEVKLWRNPEARRKVIAQILDYANALSKWSYEDLQREVSKATNRKGNVLFEMVREKFPDVEEHRFVDDVIRTLQHGKFLLLILGDGIREGAASIASFLDRGGNLHFSLGLVEVAVYDMPDGARLVQPRVIAKTVEIARTITVLANSSVVMTSEVDAEGDGIGLPDQLDEHPKKQACLEFWKGWLDQLTLDDQSQPMPKNGTAMANRYFPLPPHGSTSAAWISAWIGWAGNKAGVYLTFARGDEGDRLYAALMEDRSAIEQELGFAPIWDSKSGKHVIAVERQFKDVLGLDERKPAYDYLSDMSNRFVNAFRHRMAELARES